MLAWVLDEAFAAGAERAVVVVSPAKPELVAAVRAMGDPRVTIAYQERQLGLAHAIVCAHAAEPCLVLLPDCLFLPEQPSARVAERLRQGADVALATELVGDEAVHRYGIVETAPGSTAAVRILEKPSPEQTTSRQAVAARYALSAWFVQRLPEYVAKRESEGGSAEIDLTGAIVAAMAEGRRVEAVPLKDGERRFDCGSPEGYERARQAIG